MDTDLYPRDSSRESRECAFYTDTYCAKAPYFLNTPPSAQSINGDRCSWHRVLESEVRGHV